MTPKIVLAFRLVYAVLVLNFLLPAISYIAAPHLTYQTLDQVNRLLGGGPYPAVESGHLWHMLGTGDHFALEVRGDSMIEAGILDGDTVLIKKTEAADTGDIVVALIDDEEATLKRFRRRGASIALEPANASYEVRILPPTRVRIQGKMVGLFRRY